MEFCIEQILSQLKVVWDGFAGKNMEVSDVVREEGKSKKDFQRKKLVIRDERKEINRQ